MCVAREQRELGAQSSASRRLALACDDLFARVLRRHRAVTDHEVADAYGVWGEKSYAGKTYMGVHRSTFVIDGDGNVARIFRDVKPAEHADQVLEALGA